MPRVFGRDLAATKATGSRFPGAQTRMLDPKQRQVATALTNATRQQSFMNQQPDPTLGAPFSSFPNNRLTVAQMGPGEPAENFPLGGEPRQWKYRIGWNFPTTPDTDRGINGELLRSLADASWLVRRCIEIRKGELCSLEWDIVPRGQSARQRRENAKRHEALITHLREFFRYPEGYFSFVTPEERWEEVSPGVERGIVDQGTWERRGMVSWQDWLNACLEDYYVGDWLALWPQRTLGNDMLGLRRVDGEHIKALLDLDGRIPPPPMPAWQQYLYGVPRASWSTDEFYYLPRLMRNMTPYGFSHIQQALVMINQALRFDMWNTAAYTESTIPMGLLETPQGFSADQIRDVADFLNGAIGDLAARQRVYPVPAGTKWNAIKPFVFDEKFAMWVIESTSACFDVQPQELGFAPARAGMGGAGFAETQDIIRRRKSLVPTARWVESWLTRIIQEQWRQEGGGDLEFKFVDLVHEESQAKFAAYEVAIRTGQRSLDELLEEAGEPGIGVGHIIETSQGVVFPEKGFVLTGNGVVPLRLPKPGEPAVFGPHQPPQPGEQVAPGAGKPPGPAPKAGGAPPKATKAADGDDAERRKHEEALLALWAIFWRRRLGAAAQVQPRILRHEMAMAEMRLQTADIDRLAADLQTVRQKAYVDAMNRLREQAGLPPLPDGHLPQGDALRLETGSQTHAAQIVQTYNTDLAAAYPPLLDATQLEPDEAKRAQAVLEGRRAWAAERERWKGSQVAATEITSAESQAAQDFSVQNPRLIRAYRWRAMMDDQTCGACATLDGQIIDPAQGPFPGLHPGCRCSLIPVMPNEGAGYAE